MPADDATESSTERAAYQRAFVPALDATHGPAKYATHEPAHSAAESATQHAAEQSAY